MKHVFNLAVLSLSISLICSCSKKMDSTPLAPKIANVTTVAGNGSYGYIDGTGTSARFDHPYGIAVDGSGTLYVGDENNALIRKITAAAAVTTFAGSSYGHADGIGTAAQFFGPDGVALDGAGNLYVADFTNNRIRKITSAGLVSTLAGSSSGYLDGTGTAAQFAGPRGLAVDAAGNVYVADSYNQRIRKVTPAGVVTTVAGSGPAGAGNGGYADGTASVARFNTPAGVAIDASGNLYVADFNNFKVRKITGGGMVSTVAGSADGEQDGTGSSAEFGAPQGIVVAPSGILYVTDYLSTVRQITPDGIVTTIAGSSGSGFVDGKGTTARFSGPAGIAIDGAGNLYIADYGNGAIRKITFQ